MRFATSLHFPQGRGYRKSPFELDKMFTWRRLENKDRE